MKTVLLAIDVQNDFTLPTGNLYVRGAENDVHRIAAFIDSNASLIDHIILTLDSHQPIHIASQCYWKDSEGYPPALFSIITSSDVENGKWMPQYNKESALSYLKALEKKDETCIIWPIHCIQGSVGWAINQTVIHSISHWCIKESKEYELLNKGMHQATEHYSIFKAAIEYPNAEETKTNHSLLRTLEAFDRILIVGEAADYCVANSINDLLNLAPHIASNIYILTDCMSWINTQNTKAKFIYEKALKLGVKFEESIYYPNI